MTVDHKDFLDHAIKLAFEAGDVIMEIYKTDFDVTEKDDKSPVTAADTAAESVILKGLKAAFPDLAIVAEEEVAAGRVPDTESEFVLVDPLDGTREFLNRNGAFTVNIALINDGKPVAGIVHAPALNRTFGGTVDGGAFEIKDDAKVAISTRTTSSNLTAVASRSHRDEKTDNYLKEKGITETVSIGSSLKFCLLAAGEADIYPRFGRTMEWDTAAGHAVLSAAGGTVLNVDGTAFLYGKRNQKHDSDFANPAFIAVGDLSVEI